VYPREGGGKPLEMRCCVSYLEKRDLPRRRQMRPACQAKNNMPKTVCRDQT